MKTLTPKDKLIELTRTLHDAQTTWDTRSQGNGPHLMPSLYHEGSYAELEHRLAQMRDTPHWRPAWWHLSQRYRWGTTHKEHAPYKRTRQGPIPRLRPNTELVHAGTITGHRIQITVYEWAPTLDYLVDQALDRLEETMHGGHPELIRLPLSVLYRALGLPAPDDRAMRNGKLEAA